MSFNLGDLFLTVKGKQEGLREVTDGIKGVVDQAKDGVGKLDKFANGFKDFAKVTGGALITVGAGLTVYAKQATDFTTDYVSNSKRLSREIGTSVEEASRLTYAFSRLGLSTDDVSTSFGIFSKKITAATKDGAANRAEYQSLQAQIEKTNYEINQTTEEMRKNGDKSGELGIKLRGLQADLAGLQVKAQQTGSSFDKLGIETQDATGKTRPFVEVLFDVADKFKSMPDGAEKTALAMDLFGRSGKDMIKPLNLGAQGIKDLEAQADKLGITLTDKTVAGVAKLIESQKKMKENTDAIKIAVGTLTAPVLAKYNEKLAQLIGKFQELNPQAKTAAASVLAFGGPIATAAGGLLTFLGSYEQSKPAFAGIAQKIPLVGSFFGALGAFLTNPYVLAITAIGIALVFVLDKFGLLKPLIQFTKDAMNELWMVMQDVLKPAFDSIKQSLIELEPYWPALRDALKVIAAVLGGSVVAAILGFVVGVAAIIVALAYITAAVIDFVAFMVKGWSDLWYNVTTGVINAWNFIKQKFQEGVSWIHNKWNELAALPGRISAWMAGVPGAIAGGLSAAVGTINGWIGTFYNSGKALIDGFANGIQSAFGRAKDVVSGGLSAVRRLLPFSDAKEGPLKDLTKSGRSIFPTLARGALMSTGSLYDAVSQGLNGLPSAVLSASVGADVGVTGGGGGGGLGSILQPGGGNVFNVVIEKDADSDYFFRKFGRNLELAEKGMPTEAGSVGG